MQKKLKIILSITLVVITAFSCFLVPASAENLISAVMQDGNIASYKYSENYDYWYTDKDDSWQKNFGYIRIYDLAAPYIGMEYDYVRVHFTYDNKDWMVQLWKGQYGPFFYGCEAGVYTKDHSDESDSYLTYYDCAGTDEELKIQTNLSRTIGGKEESVFSTPNENTWWSTGFKLGHLLQVEPASELRQSGTISFKNKEMCNAFASGLEECGFKKVINKDQLEPDSFYISGNTVGYSWKNISEAENTMVIKTAGAAVTAATVIVTLSAWISIFNLLLLTLFVIH